MTKKFGSELSPVAFAELIFMLSKGVLPTQKIPIIPGHQVVGVVDKVGRRCKRFSEGTRVGIAWLRFGENIVDVPEKADSAIVFAPDVELCPCR